MKAFSRTASIWIVCPSQSSEICRPSSFTRFWICSEVMTCRRGSTRAAFMEFACLPAHCCSIFLRRLRGQGLVHTQERRSPQLRPKFSRGRKPPHPHNLIPAHDHRPKSALRLGHMTLLQQFLDLLGGLRMSRPESVSRTPVPHP